MSSLTLKKIASMLNLSISTVSRALKDHPDIALATIRRVKDVAESLEYEPNMNAIQLKTQNTRLFALIIPNFSIFFYNSFIEGLEEECRKNNYNLMILKHGDNVSTENENIKLCRRNRVMGVFTCLGKYMTDLKEYKSLADYKTPVIFFDKVPEDTTFNKVTIDDVEAATIAAKTLIKKKKKHVLAIFGIQNLSITKRRYNTFSTYMKKTDINVHYENASSSQEAEIITLKFLEKEIIDTVFCMSDEILIGANLAIQKSNGNKERIEIVSMSDGFFPNIFFPRISYIETSGYKLSKKAYLIMETIQKERLEPAEYFVTPLLIDNKKKQ